MTRLALIGIDGCSWNVLNWLIKKGYIPNFEKIIKNGVNGRLRSIIPPVTGGAWLSLATGLNPGKTGVIDFFKHVGNWVLKPVSAEDFYGKSIWDYYSVHGLEVAVLDYPMLHPAYPLNGIMVSSWGDTLSTYPSDLKYTVENIVGSDYNIFVYYHNEKYNDIELFLKDIEKALIKKLKVSRFFAKKEWDLFVDIISHTDWLQHRMWHYIDPLHPWYTNSEKALRYRKRFAEIWQLLDEYIGSITDIFDQVLIVSDHGFGPQWGVFNLGRWIIDSGYAKTRKDVNLLVNKIFPKIIRIISKCKLHILIPRKVRSGIKKRMESLQTPFDLEESKVIVLNHTIPFGAIYVNAKFKDNVDKIVNELSESLQRFIKEKFGLDAKIWKSTDIYMGDKLHLLPDLILTINDWGCVIVKDPYNEKIYIDAPYSPRHTGSHRLHGVFIAHGEGIKRESRMATISILDVAPTILHVHGIPIPTIMDGKVLMEIFDVNSKYRNKPKYVDFSQYVQQFVRFKLSKAREYRKIQRT